METLQRAPGPETCTDHSHPPLEGPLRSCEFRCELCGHIYEKGWTEEKAREDLKQNFGDVPVEECGIVCEDCFSEIKPRTYSPNRMSTRLSEFNILKAQIANHLLYHLIMYGDAGLQLEIKRMEDQLNGR